MKSRIFVSILVLSLTISCNSFHIEKESSSSEFILSKKINSRAGYTTSEGALKVLMVYVMFKDDSRESKSWKYDLDNLPAWSKQMLNPNFEINFNHKNLTHYFYEMSHGKFYLYGDVYPRVVVPRYSQDQYKSIADVNYEVLNSLDKDVDFSQYDHWSKDKKGNYINKPDGKVDMIMLVYRNFENKLYWGNGWTGIAHLHMPKNIQTNDGVVISRGRLDKGSGLSARGGYNGFTYMKYILAHEFGHFLFGAAHINNVTHLALMTGGPVWNASRGMHSWEKEHLGWINYINVDTSQNTSIWLDDYHTTGDAARIKLGNNEWWVVENHQKISSNDWAKSKGIYIYKLTNVNSTLPKIDVQCADGNWNFKVDRKLSKLYRTAPNPNGNSELNISKKISGKFYAAFNQVYVDNSAWGDKFDAFNLDYNNLISPLSNPPIKSRSKKRFAILVTGKSNSKLKVDFIFSKIYKNTPPSKPQLLNIEQRENKYYLKWLKNKEPDLEYYILFSRVNKKNQKLKIIDKSVNKLEITNYIRKTRFPIKVYIKAVDKDGKESVNSEYFNFNLGSNNKITWQRTEE